MKCCLHLPLHSVKCTWISIVLAVHLQHKMVNAAAAADSVRQAILMRPTQPMHFRGMQCIILRNRLCDNRETLR